MIRIERQRAYLIVEVLLPFALFLCLAGNNLREFFGGDDLMNLYRYSEYPLSHWAAGVLNFWSSAWYRPMGGLVYVSLFRMFGFHPLPFKILLFAVIVFNMILYLVVARELMGSLHIASLALLLCSYHAALNGLYLDFGTIYDVLGYAFFFAALAVYIVWVATPCRPIAGSALVIVFYVAGLCCKEVVVTLPAVLLAYNLLLTRAVRSERWQWPIRSGLAVIICSALAVLYTLGKTSGPGSLASAGPLYAPHFTLDQYAVTTAHYIRQLFYLPDRFVTPTGALWILGLMTIVALLLRSRLMLFSVASIVLTQLPLSFIAPRGGFEIYIAVAFWALYAAVLMDAVIPFAKTSVGFLAACLSVAAILAAVHLQKKPTYDAVYTSQTRAYRDLSLQLERWNFRLPANGRVLIVNDPFPANWIGFDSFFLISLYAHTTHASVFRMKFASSVPSQLEIDSYDYVIDYDSMWRLLKAPGEPPANPARLRHLTEKAAILLLDGFDPPSPDGWRMVHAVFAMRIKPGLGAHLLSVSLTALDPATLSASLDGGNAIVEAVPYPGSVRIVVPIPQGSEGQIHDVRFRVGNGSATPRSPSTPRLVFVSAQIRDLPGTAAATMSTVQMNDPRAEAQLLSGFYPVENKAWRWTAGKFSVLLRTPAAARAGVTLTLSFTIPDMIVQKLGQIAITASINGRELKSAKYDNPGPYIFSADVPASLLTAESVKVDFAVNKALRPDVDKRELAIIANSVAIASR